MNDKPEALQLAEWVESFQHSKMEATGAELRRLHAQRDALLEALKRIEGLEANGDYRRLASDCQEIAYAALAKAEAQQP